MTPSILGIIVGAVLLAFFAAARNRRKEIDQDFQRTLKIALLPQETIKLTCPQKKGQWILTSKRLLIEQKEGFVSLPLDKIKSVQGRNAAGNTTTRVDHMVKFVVKAEKEYELANTNDQFPVLAEKLRAEVKKRKEKRKKK